MPLETRRSIWDRPVQQPATSIKEVYEQNGMQPGAVRAPLAPGQGIVSGGGLTITNDRPGPASAASAPAMPGQPQPPLKLKPVPATENTLAVQKIPGKDMVTGSKNLLDNMLATLDYMDRMKAQFAAEQVQPGQVQPAGSPVMPGAVQPMIDPNNPYMAGQATNYDAGAAQGQAGGVMPGQVQMNQPAADFSTVTGGQAPATRTQDFTAGGVPAQVDVTDKVAPIQRREYTTDEGKAFEDRARNVQRQPGKLAALAEEFAATFGIDKLDQKLNPGPLRDVIEEYARQHKAAKEAGKEPPSALKVAQDIAGVSETDETMEKEQRKFETRNRAKEAEAAREQAKRDKQMNADSGRLDESIASIQVNPRLGAGEKAEQIQAIMARFENKYGKPAFGKAAIGVQEQVRSTGKYYISKVLDNFKKREGKILTEQADSALNGEKKTYKPTDQEEVDAKMDPDAARALQLKKTMRIRVGGAFSAKTLEEYRAVYGETTSKESFQEAAYNGEDKDIGLKKGYDSYRVTVEARIKARVKANKDMPESDKQELLKPENIDTIAREQWELMLATPENTELRAAWEAGQAKEKPAAKAPAPAPARPTAQDGATATNPKTGQKIVLKNGKWVPLQ